MANEKSTQIIEMIEGLTILELADLVKAIEEKFGVSAAPVAVAGAAGAAAPAAEEKTEFDVILKEIGAKKLDVIKVVRGAFPRTRLRLSRSRSRKPAQLWN